MRTPNNSARDRKQRQKAETLRRKQVRQTKYAVAAERIGG